MEKVKPVALRDATVSEESKKTEEVPKLPSADSGTPKEKPVKSAFDTFMDVSSIFANPLFGATEL